MRVQLPFARMHRMHVRLPLALLVVGALALLVGSGVAFASSVNNSSPFKKGGEPICTVTSTSSSSSSTTCTATLSGKNKVSGNRADIDVSGFVVFQCQTAGSTPTTGQNQVAVETQWASSIPLGVSTFTTSPAVLSAPATVTAQAAGCPDGATVGNPTLTTTAIRFSIDNGSIMSFPCTASNPNGLSGTVPLSC
jgi:hypothetical protein